MLKVIRNFFNGLAFGAIQTVPSISGGTIAIILGFYFDLVKAINHFRKDYRKHLLFLIPLFLGTGFGILLLSSLVTFLLTYHSFPTMLFFMGLIAGIVPHIFAKVREGGGKLGAREIALILIPFPVLLLMAILRGETATDAAEVINNINIPFMIFIFFAGILAAAALVIPGISGSFLLLLLGLYHIVIESISSLRSLFADFSNTELLVDILKVLGPLGLGIIVGGLSMLRLIEKLLEKHQKPVYSVILGLMLASMVVLFMEPMVYQSSVSPLIIAIGIATFSVGCVTSFFLGKKRL